ncbi:cytochrome b/b6 domain-containing protein [Acetobacteraceae bacterium H6797]|nr:cytochrome b/b6 domain-containing protein [Acetobacteraceae bacterium H6797]
MTATARVKVWDIWVRLFHWALVALLGLMWWTAETGRMDLHVTLGLAMFGLLVFRIVWGIVGSGSARFSDFVRSPVAAVVYLAQAGRKQRDVEMGHNAAGGLMVLLLLLLLVIQVGTGLVADDGVFTKGPLAGFVPGWLSEEATSFHGLNFNLILGAAGLHILAVLVYLLVKRQNLIGPMITGRKTVPASIASQAPRIASFWRGAGVAVVAALAAWGLGRL